jgi:biopolymer transport protein ExbB
VIYLSEIFEKGGPVLYVIVTCSIIAMSVAIERWIFYRQVEREDAKLMPELRQALLGGTVPAAEQEGGPLSRIWHALNNRGSDQQARTAGAEATLFAETLCLENHLYILATLGTIAPLLGLLGTVLGMVKTFHAVSLSGVTNPTMLAGGISEALYNTAGGLMVTVPCIIAYNFYRNRGERLTGVLEARFKELTALLFRGEHHDAG